MRNVRGQAALCAGIALAAGVVAGIGVFLRGDGAAVAVESVRGEPYAMATTGVYAHNAVRVVAEGVGWDLFTLLAAAPALLLAAPAVARGSLRGRLFALGLLAYLFYQYLMYAVTWALGPLFLPFVALYAASLAGIVRLASALPREGLRERFTADFPRRGLAALSLFMAAALTAMWLARISTALRGDLQGAMLLGQTTLPVQALDLGLVVPLAVYTGVALLRRAPVGYVLASVVVVKAVAMSAAICAMLLSAWVVEGRLDAGGLALFAGATAGFGWLGVRAYRSVAAPGEQAAGEAVPARAGRRGAGQRRRP